MAAGQAQLIAAIVALVLIGQTASTRPAAASSQARQLEARRIVSLVPALTEILFAIGAGPQLVAVSSFDEYPPEVLKLPRVEALLDPDTERILSLRPDLVMVYESQDSLKAQLRRAGISVFDYRHSGLGDIAPVFLELGSLTGHQAEAATRAHAIESKLSAIRALVEGRPRPAALLVMGREPQSLRNLDASGGVGFLHDLVELAGGANVFADVRRQAVRASTEMLLARAPEVVLDLHYGDSANPAQVTQERAAWQLLGSIPAVRTGRIHLLFGDHLVVPGPRVTEAAETFARALHPEAFD